MTTKTKAKGRVGKMVESAVDAAEELGQAASAFKQSWDHVQKARQKARPATKAATRAGKRAVKAAKGGMRRAAKAAKKALPKRKK